MSAEQISFKDHLKVALLSWNVGNTEPDADLNAWLKEGTNEGYEIIAIGVQECRFSHKKEKEESASTSTSILSNSKALLKSPKTLHEKRTAKLFWNKVEALLPGYTALASKRRLEMELRVYVVKQLVSGISRIRISNEATGVGHVIGNKGGIAISFDYQGTSFCFLSAHFAAHQEKVLARRENYYEIVSNLRVGRKNFEITNQFDYFYWMGDLNYRIDDLSFEQALDLATRRTPEALGELYRHDQLQKELDSGLIFHRFSAPVPSFPPTYRMKKGVFPREYNPELGRIPSWCDRILLQASPNEAMRAVLQEFVACETIITSDHTPIRAVYSNTLRKPIPIHSKAERKNPAPFEIVLSNLRGQDLYPADSSGTSDPFLKFSCRNIIKAKVTTHYVLKTLNPIWDETVVLQVLPLIPLDLLQQCNVYVEVLDRDITKTDKMGQFMLSLLEPTQTIGTNVSFIAPIFHHGKAWGTIQGDYQIRKIISH